MKSANVSEQNNEKLRVYLGSKGISTTAIDARAFARSKIAVQNKGQTRTLRATTKPETGIFLFMFFVILFFVDGRHGAWNSLELSMVIAKDRHADRATRLEKALDDEASADRTELEQGIAPMGVNFIKGSMKRSTGYGVCSLHYSKIFRATCFCCA